jgi:choline dehydrogenase-like flavoprotein
VDALTKKDYEIGANAVVVAASTVESGRILLNSKSRFHPAGIGNSSGAVGRYLMDSVKSGAMTGVVPQMKNRPRINEDGANAHVFIPRFNYKQRNDFHGGYIIGVGSGFGRGISSSGGLSGWGLALKKKIREEYGSTVSLRAYGERLARRDRWFEIDPQQKDTLGIPQVRFHCAHDDNDLKMRDDMYGWMEQILRSCDAEIVPHKRSLEAMGDATHEVGSARMGNDPATSALNSYCQAHDVKNLFVTDGSPFVSLPGTNGTTLTIMALAWRACEFLAEQARKGEI